MRTLIRLFLLVVLVLPCGCGAVSVAVGVQELVGAAAIATIPARLALSKSPGADSTASSTQALPDSTRKASGRPGRKAGKLDWER